MSSVSIEFKYAVIENIVTLVVCAAVVLGLGYFDADGWGWGLLILLNLNSLKQKKEV